MLQPPRSPTVGLSGYRKWVDGEHVELKPGYQSKKYELINNKLKNVQVPASELECQAYADTQICC